MNSLIIGVHQSKKQRILFKVRCFFSFIRLNNSHISSKVTLLILS